MSRGTETLVVITCLAVLSVLSWFVVRQIAGGASDSTEHVTQAAPPAVVNTTPPPVVVAQQTPPTPPVTGESSTVATETTTSVAPTQFPPQSIVQGLQALRGARSYADPSEMAAMNNFLWGVYPYICIVLFFAIPILRMIFRPFSWSTRASGLFGRQLLGVASQMFHWGLALLLLGHLSGLIGGVLGSQFAITFFYWSGLAGGLLVLVGTVLALFRRFTSLEVRAISQPDDYIVHCFLIVIVAIALYQVIVHRIFGIAYGASSWAASLWTLSPQPELMASASLLTKLHVLTALTFFGYFPFTKLVHFWTFPINYLFRPRISMRTQKYRFQRRWEFAWRSDKSWLTYGLASVAVIFIISASLLGRATPNDAAFSITDPLSNHANNSLLTGYPLYVSQCARCHGVNGRGDGAGANSPTFTAIPRDLVEARYHFVSTDNGIASDDDLYRAISRGLTSTGMPGFTDLTNDQIFSLIDVLNAFRAEGSKAGNALVVGAPPDATSSSIERGKALFAEICASCHGDTGRGDGLKKSYDYLEREVKPADLVAGNIKSGSNSEDLYWRITAGIPGGFGGGVLMLSSTHIPESDKWALVHYLQAEILPKPE